MKSGEIEVLEWKFPLPEPSSGILLGNGRLGLMVWGGERLCLTVSRNGFWDRRGGALPRSGATFKELRRLLEAGDDAGVQRLFTQENSQVHPTQIPGARLELRIKDWRPDAATLDLPSGTLNVSMKSGAGERATISVHVARGEELAWVECDSVLGKVEVVNVPMWKFLCEELSKIGYQPPEVWEEEFRGGVCQKLPDDPALAIAWEWQGRNLVIATALGDNPRLEAETRARSSDLAAITGKNADWWKKYWDDIPRLSLPDPELQRIYLYGVFQQAGLTPAEGVAATLVGPWMEEIYLPGWSNDYHFNINAQMIYWPCLATNRTDHLRPLWKMILGWMPNLRQNARRFFEVEDALMLPHAVNDRGETVDNFWPGMVDHGCTAWMAQLAWLHYRYTMDLTILREIAWPLLIGAFNGYWAMAEETKDGGAKRLSLPLTVSPEYGGTDGKVWGRDASFQLAAWHMVAAILPRAAAALGEVADPRWERVRHELPPYSTLEGMSMSDGSTVRRIGLWQGQDLDGSHRHHSHLAQIYPFATVDPISPQHHGVMIRTLQHWVARGASFWAGWSQPWAAAICARCNHPDAAITWLHWWRNIYTTLGYGSDHNGAFFGCTVYSGGHPLSQVRDHPVIQLDGAMGAITAILELLVQCRGDEIVIVPRVPRRWNAFSFDGVGAEGGFLIGATIEEGVVQEVRITSRCGSPLRLRHSLGNHWRLDNVPAEGDLMEMPTGRGQKLILKRN